MNAGINNIKVSQKSIGRPIKTTTPLVSIIIPAYDVTDFIAETLDSVRAQTFTDYETIVVNDGSTDTEKLEQVLRPYWDEIIYIKQKNSGVAAARNTAIKAARGQLLAFLDGDDVWLPDYLAEQVKALKTKECDLIYSQAELFGQVQNKFGILTTKNRSSGIVTTESLILEKCNIITSGTVVKHEKVLECGLFDENLPNIGFEDFDLWFRLAKAGINIDYQNKVLLKYRIRSNSLSGTKIKCLNRSNTALDICAQKHSLTPSELEALKEQKEFINALFEIEKGKYNIIQENFAEACENFREANKYFRKFKLLLLISVLKINPKLVLNYLKRIRSSEIDFIRD